MKSYRYNKCFLCITDFKCMVSSSSSSSTLFFRWYSQFLLYSLSLNMCRFQSNNPTGYRYSFIVITEIINHDLKCIRSKFVEIAFAKRFFAVSKIICDCDRYWTFIVKAGIAKLIESNTLIWWISLFYFICLHPMIKLLR